MERMMTSAMTVRFSEKGRRWRCNIIMRERKILCGRDRRQLASAKDVAYTMVHHIRRSRTDDIVFGFVRIPRY